MDAGGVGRLGGRQVSRWMGRWVGGSPCGVTSSDLHYSSPVFIWEYLFIWGIYSCGGLAIGPYWPRIGFCSPVLAKFIVFSQSE